MTHKKHGLLKFNKSDIASMLNVNLQELNKYLPEEIKKELSWTKGVQYFRDVEVFRVLKYFKGLLSDEEIKKIIYPKGY